MSTLIEGFPDDVSLMFLARVPLYLHPRLMLVCRAWKAAVNSVDLLKIRKVVNFIEDFMCVRSREPDNIWQLHDPLHDVWITIPVLPSQIMHLSNFRAVSMAGKLYVLGGDGNHRSNLAQGLQQTQDLQQTFATDQVWSYEPVTRRWTLCAPMILARAEFACGVLDGKIIVAGGYSNSSLQTPIKQAEMYDPENDVWISIPDLLHTGLGPCYGVVVRGKMNVLYCNLSTVQMLDNETHVWTECDCSWLEFRQVVVGDAVYVKRPGDNSYTHKVRGRKQIKFKAEECKRRIGFVMTSLGDHISLMVVDFKIKYKYIHNKYIGVTNVYLLCEYSRVTNQYI